MNTKGSLLLATWMVACGAGGSTDAASRPASSASPHASADAKGDGGGATCAGAKRCPKSAPICAVTAAGASCVASGTREHAATKADQRWGCTRQSDCDGTKGCFFVVGEGAWEERTLCREPDPSGANPGVCDVQKDVCAKGDAECVACRPIEEVAKHLPWVGAN